jgi:hypothetical protein
MDHNGINIDNLNITDVTVAKAVVNEAKSYNVYKGDMPENDGAMLTVANEMVNLAKRALTSGAKGEAVGKVLSAAIQQPSAAPAPAAPAEDDNPFTQAEQAPVAAPAPVAPAAVPTPASPVAEAPPVTQGESRTINDIIPDYDDQKVGDILAAMQGLTDQDIASVKTYEASEGERPKILKFEKVEAPTAQEPAVAPPVAAAPVPTPEPTPEVANTTTTDPTATATADGEPWAGYTTDKIPEIMEKIEVILASGDTDHIKKTFAAVWNYEASNKNRSRLLGKLKAIADNGMKSTGGTIAKDVDPTAPPVAAPPAAPAVPATETQPDDADVKPQAAFPTTGEVGGQPVNAAPVAQAPAAAPPVAPSAHISATQGAIDATAKSNLPIPQDIPDDNLEIPYDFESLSNEQVRSLQGKFNAAYAFAHLKVSEHEGFADDAKQYGDKLINDIIAAGQAAGKSVGEQQAKALGQSPEAQEARRTQNEEAKKAKRFRALADVYYSTCERLSREQTGRQKDHETVR